MKFAIEKSGACKKIADGRPVFYEVGEVVEFDSLPPSLVGKAKPLASASLPDMKININNPLSELVSVSAERNGNEVVITVSEVETKQAELSEEEQEETLRAQYEKLSGKKSDGRWNIDRLKEEIEKLTKGE